MPVRGPRASLHAIRSWGYRIPRHWQRDWREADFCVIDIETTGLNPRTDEVISVGMVPISAGRIQSAQTLYLLINPNGEVGRESMKIHSLRRADLLDAPPASQQIDAIMAAVEGKCVVAHTAWIETEFLNRVLRSTGRHLPLPVVDTAVLAERCLTYPHSASGRMISLEYASDLMHLPVHTPHHALGDAMTTAQLFLALATRLSAGRVLTAAELALLSRK